ncbi:FAD-dependent monooxygenase [Frigoriflavimonas asaccharolytica]|uniref:2-polyprenyl-6-methoxyphenol hydroxylase-like FAD-dependent oxidoreductase n=1 Tax=Frigoriflavimonas asaccharolytica TaxID=2735899 RepID=A0A8J8GAR1_9FLAO|nr:FAD-dependent monooxygenase [Frigoriflavimonas asaccharolytica]NRS93102.1 2-polyprenyl-6-methoxyphenol hydroxylase-like FAD-dependent oxidoreductase [Frigoriflavimonas asaccharolytica]
MKNESQNFWKYCEDCDGIGKNRLRIRKKIKLRYEKQLKFYQDSDQQGAKPVPPENPLLKCEICDGTGILRADQNLPPNFETLPKIAIIGGGIGGIALAAACLHRGIPFILYEKDISFDSRKQGYGLTLQQASKAINALGISKLSKGLISTRHVVHNEEGKILGEWGMRKWLGENTNYISRRKNIHIGRQNLRLELLNQLDANNTVKWGHQLLNLKNCEDGSIEIEFNNEGKSVFTKPDLIVGADGIRSTVRSLTIDESEFPLRYLDCIVILGICSLDKIKNVDNILLDSETVFQTANGIERMYMMPYSQDEIMWQFSYQISEKDAKILSEKGSKVLKKDVFERVKNWHAPIPEIISATSEDLISGYPVYDRELLNIEILQKNKTITFLGDAAHPMSPFKGQGANQALLDALNLAKLILKNCKNSDWRKNGIRTSVLNQFEEEMLKRSATKVEDSRNAAEFLHTEKVLIQGNQPRGNILK